MAEIRRLLGGFVPAASVCAIPAALIWLDTVVWGFGCRETGVVEIAQSACLLAIVALMATLAARNRGMRGGFVLVAGFFAAMFVREQDAILDSVFHGFWLVPALAVTAAAVAVAWRGRSTVLPALSHIGNGRRFQSLSFGLFLLLVFSRVLGHKAIWMAVCDMANFKAAKHVAEEGMELLAYSILLHWATACFADMPPAESNLK